jgi:pimeloyl-ACP methyl ester carboxylesterase
MNLAAINANYDRLNGALPDSRTFDKPILFIRGERSDYIRNDEIELIQARFPQAEFCEVADAGHWVHADAPESFLRKVREFLQR